MKIKVGQILTQRTAIRYNLLLAYFQYQIETSFRSFYDFDEMAT